MIYLDNAATTKPLLDALSHAAHLYEDDFFNPSARYGGGASAAKTISSARERMLSLFADPTVHGLIFTSCGTEADNQAIFGCAKRGNAVTTAGEHSAVERSFNELKNRGVEVRIAPVRADGSVDKEALLSLVDEKTSLVSVVHVNNETGAINDIAAIARAVKAKNPRCIFHSDGVQAFGKLPFRLPAEVDLYAVSAHKIGGVKGCGGLFKRKTLALPPYLYGGGQENGLRSGTENTFGIETFAHAAEMRFSALTENANRAKVLREMLFSSLQGVKRLSPEDGSPYILTVSATGTRGEVLVRMLWDMGVVVGTGSACSSKNRYSRILTACGYPAPVLDGVLRFSLCPETTEEDVLKAASAVNTCIARFRASV